MKKGNRLKTGSRATEHMRVFSQAVRLHNQGQLENAEKLYQQLLDSDYRTDSVLCNLALILCKRRDFDQASELLVEALEINPVNTAVLNNLGRAVLDLKRFDEAEAYLTRALEVDPSYIAPKINLGMIYIETDRYDDAEEILNSVLDVDPGHTGARANLLIVYQKTGRIDRGASLFTVPEAIQSCNEVPFVAGDVFHAKCKVLDWTDYDENLSTLKTATLQGLPVQTPFVALAANDDLLIQQRAAELFIRSRFPEREPMVAKCYRYNNTRLKVAYLSSDFYDHATMYLVLRLLKGHDPAIFETFALSARDDPLAKELFMEFNGSPMNNVGFEEDQARAVLEYLRLQE